MTSEMQKIIKRYLADRKGNVALMTAILLPTLLLIGGMTVDYSRFINVKGKAQVAADSAVFAAIREVIDTNNIPASEQVGDDFLNANLAGHVGLSNANKSTKIEAGEDGGSYNVESSISVEYETIFMKLANINDINFNVKSSAEVNIANLEVSLVLDVSQTMRNGGRIGRLQTAAEDFIDIIDPVDTPIGYRVVSLVPFANNVNFGPRNDDLLGRGTRDYPSSDFVGCYEPESDAQLALPEPNNVLTDTSNDTGLLAYENTINNRFRNPLCPPSSSSVTLFSGDRDELVNNINNLGLGFGTATDLGLSWGWRTVLPQWRGILEEGSSYPRDFATRNQKFIILLTDGAIFRRNWEINRSGRKRLDNHTTEAERNFNNICNNIRTSGNIRVFTIGYETARLGRDLQDALRNCASNPGDFYEASRSDINTIFNAIAKDITSPILTN